MENASKALIIAGAILISILIISLGVLVYNQASSTVSKANLNSQEAQAQNSKFESYFGTDVTAQEVKNLLSEVRTNNLTASRNEESATIGICYMSVNATGDGTNGVYGGDTEGANTNPAEIAKDSFDKYNFTPDVQLVTNLLKAGTSYTVNVPNTRAWKADQQGTTGFEAKEDDDHIDELGGVVDGKSGGYYSSGYIRLIYIIDNANRAGEAEPET